MTLTLPLPFVTVTGMDWPLNPVKVITPSIGIELETVLVTSKLIVTLSLTFTLLVVSVSTVGIRLTL